ncbi:hypothetical protein BH11MYX3_BH11MYX3_19510 [soil metagenome]
MYRDSANSLDEHDRAAGAILIGEAMLAQCERAVERVRDPALARTHARWRAMREIHDDYPEIWLQLDRARSVLAARGGNTAAYEELRPHVRPSLIVPSETHETAIDPEALDDARRAVAELKLAVPGADWKAIARRTSELVEMPQLHRRHRLAVGGTLTALAIAIVTWFVAITPEKKLDRTEAMRHGIAAIAGQRKVRIDILASAIGDRCSASLAHEYVKLLVMDGRGDDAETFADGYIGRCGEDSVVENWANAPRPPR